MDFTGTAYTPHAAPPDSAPTAPTGSGDVGAAKSFHDIEKYVKDESIRLKLNMGLEANNTTVNTELSSVDEPLPMKDEVSNDYQIIQSSGNENDCLVHSLLTALSPTFRTLDVNGKNTIASNFRRGILVALYDKLIDTKNNQREKMNR